MALHKLYYVYNYNMFLRIYKLYYVIIELYYVLGNNSLGILSNSPAGESSRAWRPGRFRAMAAGLPRFASGQSKSKVA